MNVEKTASKPVKSKRNGTSFSKENPRPGPGRGHKNPEVRAAYEGIVRDMELGYNTDETKGESIGVKQARKLAKEDYPKFLMLYLKAKEQAGLGEAPQKDALVAAAATAEAGVKEEGIEELANRLLAEWEQESSESVGSVPCETE